MRSVADIRAYSRYTTLFCQPISEKTCLGSLGLNMRNYSNNEGTVAKRKFMSVCPFGLIEFYCENIIDCKLCDMLQLKLVFRKYGI